MTEQSFSLFVHRTTYRGNPPNLISACPSPTTSWCEWMAGWSKRQRFVQSERRDKNWIIRRQLLRVRSQWLLFVEPRHILVNQSFFLLHLLNCNLKEIPCSISICASPPFLEYYRRLILGLASGVIICNVCPLGSSQREQQTLNKKQKKERTVII